MGRVEYTKQAEEEGYSLVQTIILDKSAFQSLSPEEIRLLFNRYAVVVTPVLLIEVLADIKKSKEEVQNLAKKLLSENSVINAHYRALCKASLLLHFSHRCAARMAKVERL